jgi:arylsulfatase A-like enzyme
VVSSIDLVPTLLAAAGARIPEDLPGLNLLEPLRTGTPLARDAIFGETFAHDIADLDNPEASLLFRWCIAGRWKLLLTYDGETHRYAATHPRTEKRPQLFDLLADPHEEVNVAEKHPEIVAELADRIDAWYPVRERNVLKRWP